MILFRTMRARVSQCRYVAATLACAAMLGWLAVAGARAQEAQRIIAIVNDEVISNSDLVNRVRLTLLGAGLEDTQENRQRVAQQILRTLVEERLQMQEAARLSVTVTDAEIDERMQGLEQANRLPRGGLAQLLRESRIPRSTMEAQLRAALAWQKIVYRRLRPAIDVGDDEVEEVLARFKSSQGVTENLLSEIFLAVRSEERRCRERVLRSV